jgi:protein SCO1/2
MSRRRAQKSLRRQRLAFLLGGTALLLVLAGLLLWLPGFSHVADSPQPIGGPFRLVDDTGQQVTDRSFPGRYQLIYFGYTACPDVCPTALAAIGDAMASLGTQARRVQPLFITVDPQHDTAPVLRHYVAAIAPQVIGLTGPPGDVAAVAREFRVQYRIVADRHGTTTLDHSSVLFLLDPAGHFVSAIRADLSGRAIASEISRHLS